jgi:hypothetical protein
MAQKFVIAEVRTNSGAFVNAHQYIVPLDEAVQSTPGVWWDGTSNLDTFLALEVGQFTSHSAPVGNSLVYFYITRIV